MKFLQGFALVSESRISSVKTKTTVGQNCRLSRRLGAILYDSLLLFSVLLFATIPVLLITKGEAVESGNLFYTAYLLLVCAAYFMLPWLKSGQTLAMQTWKIKLVQKTGQTITPGQALLRLILASISWLPLGLGFLWSVIDREKLTWHDRLSGTRIIQVQNSTNMFS